MNVNMCVPQLVAIKQNYYSFTLLRLYIKKGHIVRLVLLKSKLSTATASYWH